VTISDAIADAIRAFDFSNYGLDDVDPKSVYAEWVPDLAEWIRSSIEQQIREQVARDIGTHPGPIDGEWMDSRDRIAAARIARNGATQ
jgi:hypothetical protein